MAPPPIQAGTWGTLKAPVATTTVSHRHSPWFVVTRYSPLVRRTEETGVPDSTGAAITFRVVGDEVDDLGHRHEAVGVAAAVGVAGEAALPVRREQTERIPPLGPPRVGDLAPFEDYMVDGAL